MGDEDISNLSRWDRDSKLTEISDQGLFDEYLEMGESYYPMLVSTKSHPLEVDCLVRFLY